MFWPMFAGTPSSMQLTVCCTKVRGMCRFMTCGDGTVLSTPAAGRAASLGVSASQMSRSAGAVSAQPAA